MAVTSICGVLVAVFVSSGNVLAYQLGWQAFYAAPPIIVALGVVGLLGSQCKVPAWQRQEVMLVLSVLSLCTLIQFPFSKPVYFCYVAPLLFLAVAAIQRLPTSFVRGSGAPLLTFSILFPVVWVTPGFVFNIGKRASPNEQTARLTMPRGGNLRITKVEADEYNRLVRLVTSRAPGSSVILAGPDSPEIYFLSGKPNPTRLIFEFLEPAYSGQFPGDALLQKVRPTAVILNSRPHFSKVVSNGTVAMQYPMSENIDQFTVRWR